MLKHAFVHDSNHKGNVAEAAIAFHAARLGISLLRPLYEHGRYDLVLEFAGQLLRVQCKSACRKGDVVIVRLVTNRRGPRGYIRTKYSRDEIDAVAAYCAELDRCYLLPGEIVCGKSAIQLRINPPRNGQRAAIHFETESRLGAVAQLGERLTGSQEARGSSPLSSISSDDLPAAGTRVGAHEFRERFGWYLELAERGQEITVTRRGRPAARLVPGSCPARRPDSGPPAAHTPSA